MKGRQQTARGTGETDTMVKTLLWGTGGGALLMLILLCICAAVMTVQDFNVTVLRIIALATLGLGGFGSGFLAAKLRRKNGMLMGALSGAALMVILVLLSLIFFGFHFGGQLITKVAIGVLTGALGGVLGVNHRKKHH